MEFPFEAERPDTMLSHRVGDDGDGGCAGSLFIYNYPPAIDTLVRGMVVVAVMVVMMVMVIVVGDGEYQDIILSHKVGEATPTMMR